ncbi:MAG TPA: helix-turn-helix domain-containing protein, partial [Devosia sp.]|nr:helix-turn-helix domain-containing protein [Devosia sp.]
SGEIAALAEIERAAIVFAIEHHGGRMSRVARALKIGRSTLYRKLHEYGLAEELINDAA